MKCPHLFILFFLLLFPIVVFSQAGYYEYIDKETKFVESFELSSNGNFSYIKQGEWANTVVSGTWTFNLDESITLTSKYQLNDLLVEESMNTINGEIIYLTLTAPEYKQGPRSISTIMLNENPAYGCQMMQDKILAAAEERNRILTSGRQIERDSALKAYQPIYFECNAEGLDSLESIKIEFDKKQVEYLPVNTVSTAFNIQFNLAPNQTYRYFKEERYNLEKKAIISKSGKKFKKTKN